MSYPSVTVVDYGMGNIWSVKSALEFLNCKVNVSSDPRLIVDAEAMILPGVGSFRKAMHAIRRLNLEDAILEAVVDRKTKILGICLGMQLMAIKSTEDGETQGLRLISTDVDEFSPNEVGHLKVPHVGFNQVNILNDSTLFHGISGNHDFYFVHSFRMLPSDLHGVLTTCKYGIDFLAAYENKNIFATQFHPEKSQTNGLKLLANFLRA